MLSEENIGDGQTDDSPEKPWFNIPAAYAWHNPQVTVHQGL
jgi:hypothetical protein